MTVLIIGYPGSGKSKLAEDMIMNMSDPGERIYLATMIPYGEEGRERIGRHRRMREGKGFVTIEAPFDAADSVARQEDSGDKSVLLECLSNLVANEMFERHTDSRTVAENITTDVLRLRDLVRDLVIVSNHFETEEDFDEETMLYARTLDAVNDRLSAAADKVIRISPERRI